MVNKFELEFIGYWLQYDAGIVPNKRGIYCVYSCKYNSKSGRVSLIKLIYVGAAENIREQILEGLECDKWRSELGLDEEFCFSYGEVIQQRDAINLEQYLQIRKLLEYSSKAVVSSEYVNFPINKDLVVHTRGANRLLKNGEVNPQVNENVIQYA